MYVEKEQPVEEELHWSKEEQGETLLIWVQD